MKFQDFVRAEAGDREEFKDAGRHFLAQLLQARVRSRLMKLRHDVGDGIADAGDLCERASRDDAIQRLGKSRDCRPRASKPSRGKDCRRAAMFSARIP